MKVRTFENKKKRAQLRYVLLLTEEEAEFIQTSLKNTLPFVRRQYNIEREEAKKPTLYGKLRGSTSSLLLTRTDTY